MMMPQGLVSTPQQQEQQKQMEREMLQRQMLAQILRGGGQAQPAELAQMLGNQGGGANPQQTAIMRSLASLGGF
jgi:hypothetical protein